MKRLISKLSLLFLLVIFWSSPLTSSNYYDTETSSGNIITAGFWDATPPAISNVLTYWQLLKKAMTQRQSLVGIPTR